MINIQLEMAERCMELLMLPEDETCLLLDLGCGSGLSGSVAEESGHIWFGMDISSSMLSMLNNLSMLFLQIKNIKETIMYFIIFYIQMRCHLYLTLNL